MYYLAILRIISVLVIFFSLFVSSCSHLSLHYTEVNPTEELKHAPTEMNQSEIFILPTGTDVSIPHFDSDRVSNYQTLEYRSTLVQLSIDGQFLATNPDNNLIRVLKFPSLELLVDLTIPRAAVNGTQAIAFSHDNQLIAVGGLENRVDLFNLDTGSIIDSLYTEDVFSVPVMVSDLMFLPGDQNLIFASNNDNGGIASWSYTVHESSRYLTKPVQAISDIVCEDQIAALSWPTGNILETYQPLILFNLESFQFVDIQLNGVVGSSVQYFDSCSKIAAIIDGVVYVIDISDSTFIDLQDILGDELAVRLDVSSDGLLAVLTSESYLFPSDTIYDPFYKPEAKYVLSLIDVDTLEVFAQIPLFGITDIDITLDGSYLVIASLSQPLTIWKIQ